MCLSRRWRDEEPVVATPSVLDIDRRVAVLHISFILASKRTNRGFFTKEHAIHSRYQDEELVAAA